MSPVCVPLSRPVSPEAVDAAACGSSGAAEDGELRPEDGGECFWICSDGSKTRDEGVEEEDLQQTASQQDRSCCEFRKLK